jgi:hypothetical protein
LLGTAFVFAAVSSLSAQTGSGSTAAPNLGASGVANSSSSYPWNRKALSVRVQYVYDQSEMPGFPVTISAIRFRAADSSSASWTGGTYGGMTILMSHSVNAYNAQTNNFANNHGAGVTTVFSGSAVLTAGSGTGPGVPSKPYVSLTLAGGGFKYDPAKGPLLTDFASDGTKYTGGTTATNAVTSGTNKASRMFNLTDHLATTGSVQQNVGLVMEFDYTFTGTHISFSNDSGGGVPGTKVNFADTSITAGTGGILAHDWDLDGDGKFGDANTAKPSWTYNTPGKFDIGHKITTVHGTFTLIKTGLIEIVIPTASVPDLIQYQFNEVRGNLVANSATGSVAPSQGVVSNTGWQGQGKGPLFTPNEAGFGMMAQTATASSNGITTGYSLDVKGDITICWWQRMIATAPANAFGYVFGGSGSSFRCFNRGAAGTSMLFRGTSYGDLNFTKSLHDTNWHHMMVVVDDTNGEQRAYVDGELTNTVSGTANSHASTNTGFKVGYHTSAASNHAKWYDIDDFRFYTKALSLAEALGAGLAEAASTGNYGTLCYAGPGSAATISGNGAPTIGNATFAAELNGAGIAEPYAMVVGFFPGTAGYPLDISGVLGTGCVLECPLFLIQTGTTVGGAASMSLPIPAGPYEGLHAYVQAGFVGTTTHGATDLLDINIQKN